MSVRMSRLVRVRVGRFAKSMVHIGLMLNPVFQFGNFSYFSLDITMDFRDLFMSVNLMAVAMVSGPHMELLMLVVFFFFLGEICMVHSHVSSVLLGFSETFVVFESSLESGLFCGMERMRGHSKVSCRRHRTRIKIGTMRIDRVCFAVVYHIWVVFDVLQMFLHFVLFPSNVSPMMR